MATCGHCGGSIGDQVSVCRYCGSPIAPVAGGPAVPPVIDLPRPAPPGDAAFAPAAAPAVAPALAAAPAPAIAPALVAPPAPAPVRGTVCRSCGVEGPVRLVTFRQNMGLLIVRRSRSIRGNLCKHCAHDYFWQFTTVTLFMGWWGVISFFVTLFNLPANIIAYLGTLTLAAPNSGAPRHSLSGGTGTQRVVPYVWAYLGQALVLTVVIGFIVEVVLAGVRGESTGLGYLIALVVSAAWVGYRFSAAKRETAGSAIL
jgi:hypothetical protein